MLMILEEIHEYIIDYIREEDKGHQYLREEGEVPELSVFLSTYIINI